jgi:hypothetical protein
MTPLAWHTPTDQTTCVPGIRPSPVAQIALKAGDHVLSPIGTSIRLDKITPLAGRKGGYQMVLGGRTLYPPRMHWFLVPDTATFQRLKAEAAANPVDLSPPNGFRFPNPYSLRLTSGEIDSLTPGEFELFVSALLEFCECWSSVRRGGHANDRAADILAVSRSGQYMSVQCKHTKNGKNVGVNVMYEVLGTAGPEHGATLALVVTNGGFTRDARSYAHRHGILTVGRDGLLRAAAGGVPLHGLLSLDSIPARPGRTQSGSRR